MSKIILTACVLFICGTGLLMLIPVTFAVAMDFVKSMKEIFRK